MGATTHFVAVLKNARAALLLLAAAVSVRAGQPLMTDEAAVIAPKTCQLEAWSTFTRDDRAYWAQPACNLMDDLELTVGLARVVPDQGDRSSLVQLQAKTVLFARGDGDWSFGALGGSTRDTGAPHGGSAFQVFYAKGLVSLYPRQDLEVDLNLGAANAYGRGTFALAGAALQYEIVSKWQLLAEAFRDQPGRGGYQGGLRYSAVPDRFEAYASYGNRFGSASNRAWLTVGIRLQTAHVLP